MMARERPGTEVVPSYYPIRPAKKAAVTALSLVQYGAIGAILFADALSELLRTHLGVQVDPAMVANVKSKRVQWCLGLWWIGNVVKNGLQSTGAFEVFYDGHEIFSKLKMGRMPNVDDLAEGIQAVAAGRTPTSIAA